MHACETLTIKDHVYTSISENKLNMHGIGFGQLLLVVHVYLL